MEDPNIWEDSLQSDKGSNPMQLLSTKLFGRRKGAFPHATQLSFPTHSQFLQI